jgi:hypothetical protein
MIVVQMIFRHLVQSFVVFSSGVHGGFVTSPGEFILAAAATSTSICLPSV